MISSILDQYVGDPHHVFMCSFALLQSPASLHINVLSSAYCEILCFTPLILIYYTFVLIVVNY